MEVFEMKTKNTSKYKNNKQRNSSINTDLIQKTKIHRRLSIYVLFKAHVKPRRRYGGSGEPIF